MLIGRSTPADPPTAPGRGAVELEATHMPFRALPSAVLPLSKMVVYGDNCVQILGPPAAVVHYIG